MGMWKAYSISYLKNNQAMSISIMVAALIAAMLLSLITSVFYNLWTDNINQIISKEGDWQAKITGSVGEEERQRIKAMANVKDVVIIPAKTGEETLVYYYQMWSIYEEMPKIAKLIKVDSADITYHETLLSEYFIFAPDHEHPPMLLAFYLAVMMITVFALILIIRNAFMVSMESRLHQLGILQSIGATPGQLRICLLQEAFGLCLLPIIVGIGAGVVLCSGFIWIANDLAASYRGGNAVFSYHFGLFLITLVVSLVTVLSSAWLPARRLSKMSPLQVIRGGEAKNAIAKVRKFRIITFLFGIEGELAAKSLYVRRKSLRTASLSLMLAFLAFSIFLCFMTLSGISTRYTYFERYKDAWDIMVTVKNQDVTTVERVLDTAALNQVADCCVYQKATAYSWLTADQLSDALQALGSLSTVAGSEVMMKDNKYRIDIPIVIMDDKSFKNYCESIGVTIRENEQGMVTINRIWDNLDSHYRNKEYVAFIKEQDSLNLSLYENRNEYSDMISIPVIAYTDQLPVLREEYPNYGLVQVMSASTWQNLLVSESREFPDTYVNIQTATDDYIVSVQTEIEQLLAGENYEIQNRVEEQAFNQVIQDGYMLMMGGLCSLLAIIGLASVFSNTLGSISQRKREVARYLSIGISPLGIKKMLAVEALILGGKPIIATIPLTIVFVIFAATASAINPLEFLESMPFVQLSIFAGLILGCVALAYYLGGRKICRSSIVEVIKNDLL